MSSLALLHLGHHSQLLKLPAFTGVENLKSMSLARLSGVREFPLFNRLQRLERLEIIKMSALFGLPDMGPLTSLVHLSLSGRGQMCCNVFLDGACNLTNLLCAADPTTNVAIATCLQEPDGHATTGTKRIFQRFESSVCIDPAVTRLIK